MLKNITITILTLISLYAATGFIAVEHRCNMPFVETAITSGRYSCCTGRDFKEKQHTSSAGFGLTDHQYQGCHDCASHDEQNCSCETGNKFFTPGEIIIIKKPLTFISTAIGTFISNFLKTFLARSVRQSVIIPINFNLPKIISDFQAEYGVFIC